MTTAFALPSFVECFIGSAVLYILYHIHWQITVGASRRALIRKHGCKPIKDNPEYNTFLDRFIGISVLLDSLKHVKRGDFLSRIRDRHLKHGNTLHAKVLFTEICTTIEPENVKTIMALNFNDWGLGARRKAAFTPLLGHGIFTTDGAAWQNSRDLLRPNFVRTQISDLDIYEHHLHQMIQTIPRDGSTVNLQDLFFLLTLDTATEFLFGESTCTLATGQAPERSARFAEAFNCSMEEVSSSYRMGKLGQWLRTPAYQRKVRDNIKFCHDFVNYFVHKGLEYRKTLDLSKGPPDVKDGDRYVFLHELVKRIDDPIRIRSELLNILLAGRDTTASLLSAVWLVFAKRPDVWAKLRAEVNELEGKRPTFQQVKDMKYLRMVLNEALRLWPAVPGNARTAEVDTVLPLGGGEDGKSPIFVPKGQPMQWALWSMHRRTDYYGEDAEEFKPERWEQLRPGWEYLPFNGGPRICIGQQFALTEASYTTIRLMQEFKSIESRDPRPWTEWLTVTCACRHGTLVGLTPA